MSNKGTVTVAPQPKVMSTPKYLAYLAIGLFFMFVFGRICPTWGPVQEWVYRE